MKCKDCEHYENYGVCTGCEYSHLCYEVTAHHEGRSREPFKGEDTCLRGCVFCKNERRLSATASPKTTHQNGYMEEK